MTPQWQGAPGVIRDTRQLARQSYTKLSLSVVTDPNDQIHLLEVELESCPESAGPVDTVRESHCRRNTKSSDASRHQAR